MKSGNELALRVRVVTQRLATTSWGAVFRISFEDIVSRASTRREIEPLYFVVTEDKIYLLNETEGDAAIERLAARWRNRRNSIRLTSAL